ncbi:MAG: sulfatase-like hydrolase/transferase [Acidimicrobiia bacterium]
MPGRPNVVLFMPDQLRADALGCFGNTVCRTANIDALAARGVRFENAFCQHPVCGPSRVSFMSGWYPHVAGHRTLTHLLQAWEPNLLGIMRDAGYYVAVPGHRGDVFAPGVTETSSDFCGYLVQPEPGSPGNAAALPDRLTRGFYFGSRGDDVVTDGDEAAIRTAEQWLADGRPADQPWLLWIALVFPHPPFSVEEPWFSLHDRALVPEPILASAASGKPGFMSALRAAYGWDELTDDDLAEIVATYYGMTSRVDWQLGRIVDAVERTGELDKTVFVVFTDHGEYLGDFGLVEKWPSGLDACLTRNPLVIAGPGVVEGGVADAMVELVDLLPTVCELGGAEVHHTHFGRSLTRVLADPTIPHREFACTEGGFRPTDENLFERAGWIYEAKTDLQHDRPELVGTAIALRTPAYTYVYRACEGDELYDRITDPAETTNLAHRPDHASMLDELRTRLLDWLAETSDVFPWKPDPRFPELVHGYRNR